MTLIKFHILKHYREVFSNWIVAIFFYSLICYSHCFAKQELAPDLNWNNDLSWDEEKERIIQEMSVLELKRIGSTEIAEKITKDLIFAISLYKNWFEQSLPPCKRCSELEMLLILERLTEIGGIYSEEIKNAVENAKKGNNNVENKLKKIEEDYNIGKAIAAYEIFLGKSPPEWHCSKKEYLNRLERALDVGAPYLSKEEETELEISLKAEYEKKFGKQISNFEFSLASVSLKSTSAFNVDNRYRISVNRTSTGAIARLLTFEPRPHGMVKKRSGIKLGIGEWLNFINALNNCHANEWEKEYIKPGSYDGHGWELAILFSIKDNNELKISGRNKYPPNWNEFMKIMKGIVTKINKETGANIREKLWWIEN